jgi:hypothetical protein
MRDQDKAEVWAALAIGAIVGVGTALLVRARQEDERYEVLEAIRPLRRGASRAAGRIADEAGDLMEAARKATRRRSLRRRTTKAVDAGREMIDDLSSRARDIVESTRKELEKAARESVKEARRAARTASRRVRG